MFKNIVAFILFGLGSLTAQKFTPNLYHSKLTSGNNAKVQSDIKILAVMVEFQPDEFDLTKGNGKFGTIYSKDYGTTIIDPLPHDIFYFSDHLEFAKNYYSKVSNGNVDISYTIIPNIITVSKVMRDYSPLSGESFKPLADFSKEVWELAVQQNSNINFSQYNLFVIFHAGVGKDISTNDLLGEARDLPSIYLGLNALKEIYGETFQGFPGNNGSLINSTLILPETESREEAGIGGTVLLQLSINGLIVSSIANHIGLPDLFDSETGISAIGRFGLMDGQSLFAYAGLFPPEPSAWEKIFLGWEQPVVVNTNSENIEVTAKQIASDTDANIIKIPINSTEYYLIENRQRDANNDGIEITYKVGGQLKTIRFSEDLDNFNNAFVDTISGVVLDVDEFDWAIPGNGILIWHIDEKIIDTGLATNKINVGDNRGVDLEEADGIQDIGVEFRTIFGDIVFAEGDEFDFWYSGNTSELYQNKFGIYTKPNTNTNSEANSLITISNFSTISNRMSFDVSFGTDLITAVNTFGPAFYYQSINNYFLFENTDNEFGLIIDSSNFVYINLFTNEIKTQPGLSNQLLNTLTKNNENYFIGMFNSILNIGFLENNNIEIRSIDVGANPSSQIISSLNGDNIEIVVGLANGQTKRFSFNTLTKSDITLVETKDFFQTPITQIATIENTGIAVSKNQLSDFQNNENTFQSEILKTVLTKNENGNIISIILTDDNTFHVVNNGQIENEFSFKSLDKIKDFSLGDIKNDGENYIVFNQGNQIYAINLTGSFADNFPYRNNTITNFFGAPLIADLNNDGISDVISSSVDGNIFAVSGDKGKVIDGFPISTGGDFSGLQSIVKRENDMLLSSVTNNNEFYFWSIKSNGKVEWGSKFGNNQNTSSLGSASGTNIITSFFPKNRTYNWPNPVYGNETFIRTFVAEDAEVKVTIFDLAGDLVDELKFNAVGGLDNEIAWNVSQVQSGAYLAHIEVKSGNKTESKIIKIAVIK